jgi:prophage regulatory protein
MTGGENPDAAAPGNTVAEPTTTPIRLIRRPEVVRVVGLQRAAIYALMREGRFPQAVRITARSVGWIESEIQAWLAEKVRARAVARKSTSSRSKKP